MKKNTLKTLSLVLAGAGALSLTSCDYLSCVLATNTQECIVGKGMDQAIKYLTNADSIDTTEKAESFASNWKTVQTAISGAQALGIKVPDSVKTAYNNTLSRIVKHNYFSSTQLKTAMSGAEYIK